MSGELPSHLRAFVAIQLPPQLLEAARQLQQRLDSRLRTRAVRWTQAGQLHLTLRFLGNVLPGQLGGLEQAVRGACAGTGPLALGLEGLGCFPSAARPHVIWIGVSGAVRPLAELAARIQKASAHFGDHAGTRAFQAHLTIGRLRDAPPGELARIGASIQKAQAAPLGQWTADKVDIVRSELSPKGAVHTVLASVRLL